MEDSLAQKFYDRLEKEPNPASILTQMYCNYYEIMFSQGLVQLFGRLVKIYGREIPFYAVLEVFTWNLEDVNNPRGALFHTAKKLFEESHRSNESVDLTDMVKEKLAKVNRIRKPNVNKVSDPFEKEVADAGEPRPIPD